MMEMELDEESDLQIALALSRFQADVAEAHGRSLPDASPFQPFHCWNGAEHVTGMVCVDKDADRPIQHMPSVATWMIPRHVPVALVTQHGSEDLTNLDNRNSNVSHH